MNKLEWIYKLVLFALLLIHLVNGRSHSKTRYNVCENVPINTIKLFNDSERCGMFVACMGKVAVHYKCFSNSVYDDGTPNCLICDADNQNSFDIYTTRVSRRSNFIKQTSGKEHKVIRRPKITQTFNSVENEDKIKSATQTESLLELSGSNEDEDELFSENFGIASTIANIYNNKVITKDSDFEITNEEARPNLNNKLDKSRDKMFYSNHKISDVDDDSDQIFPETKVIDEVGEESSIDPNEKLIDYSEICSTTIGYWGSDEYGNSVENEYVDKRLGSKYSLTNENEKSESFDEENSTQDDDDKNDNELDNSLSFGRPTVLLTQNQDTIQNSDDSDSNDYTMLGQGLFLLVLGLSLFG